MKYLRQWLVAVLMGSALAASAATVVVRTEAELQDAVSALANKGEICIVEGRYDLTKTIYFTAQNVTIRGVKEDGTTPAEREKVILNGCGDVEDGASHRVIYANGSGLTLRDLTVSNGCCQVSDANWGGGAAVFSNAKIISNCVFTCNSVTNSATVDSGGGAALLNGYCEVRDCLFENNRAVKMNGGAMRSEPAGGGQRIADCTFRNNSSGTWGGALSTRNSGSWGMISGCQFLGNSAGANGGAVYGASLGLFTNCTFALNHASTGGAFSSERTDCVTFYDCHFKTNWSSGNGGVANQTPGGSGRNDVALYGCTFDGNYTISGVGGVFNFGGGSNGGYDYYGGLRYATNTVFSNNHAGTTAGGGRAGVLCGYFGRIVDCKFIGNYQCNWGKSFAGAIHYCSAPSRHDYDLTPPVIEDSLFATNRCTGYHEVNCSGGGDYAIGDGGGAIYADDGSAHIQFNRCRFIGNSTTNCITKNSNHVLAGGVIFSRGDVGLDDCEFLDNAGVNRGGCLYIFSTTGGIRRCSFKRTYMRAPSETINFSGDSQGGAIYLLMYGKTNVIEDCVFEDNVVYGKEGGAIYAIYPQVLDLRGCTFKNNLNLKDQNTTVVGAAVCIGDTVTARVDRCAFIGNRTHHYGGAAGGGLAFYGTGYVRNCLFQDNLVTNETAVAKNCGWGGGMYAASKPVEVSNCTFVNNIARCYGGGLNIGSAGGITNCVFYGNLETYSSVTGRRDDLSASSGTTVMNTFGSVALSGFLVNGVNGCIVKDANPFRSDDHCDLAVLRPYRGLGLALDWMSADSLDLGGKPRLAVDNTVDFGCYQYWKRLGMCIILR